MALDVWFRADVAHGLASAIALVIETARAAGPVNEHFVLGVLAMARAQALAYGIPWADIRADVRSATGGQDYALLLEAATERALTG